MSGSVPAFRVGEIVKNSCLATYLIVEDVHENYRGFGKHSYTCRIMGGDPTARFAQESLQSTASEFSAAR